MPTYNRQLATSYGNKASTQLKGNRVQPNTFGTPRTGPPSYAFQDNQRGNVDDTSAETASIRNEEKKIENDQEKDIIDRTNFQKGEKSSKAQTPNATTTARPAAEMETKSAFAKCWTTVDSINIPALFNDDKSFFIPSAITLMEVLSNIETVFNGNEELRWKSPYYFSLPTRVYYSVMYYVQIYRAKEQAGTLRKSEGSWLRSFNRRFKDTSCPIVGPLVPIFSNIVSCLPDDDQFDFVYPTTKINGTYETKSNADSKTRDLSVNSVHFLAPSIPLIGGMLHKFCNTQTLTNDFFDENGNYVPFTFTNGGELGGVVFPPGTPNMQLAPEMAKLLHNPALMHSLPEGKDRLKEIHTFWKRSRARYFPAIPTNQPYDPSGPADFTMLGEDLDWFQSCVDMASIQAQFFTDSTNMSAIPTIGGQSSIVQSLLEFPRQIGTPTTLDNWYPDVFSSAKAKFRSTTADLDADHAYQAAFALTNVKLEWQDNQNNKIGSVASQIRGGPYWMNKKYNYMLEHPTFVMTGLFTLLQSQFYNARGSQ